MAAFQKDVLFKMLKLFNQETADIDQLGLSKLHRAVLDNKVNLITKLVAKGADVEMMTPDKETSLHLAAKFNKLKAMNRLIKLGADVRAQDMHGKTALHIVAEQGLVDMMDVLLAAGADIEAVNLGKATPLMSAIWMGQDKAVQKLIQMGADVNKADSYGRLPLFEAVLGQDEKMVKILLKANADLTQKDKEGLSVLDMTDDPKILSLLKEKMKQSGVDVARLASSQNAPRVLVENAINITNKQDEPKGYEPAPIPSRVKS